MITNFQVTCLIQTKDVGCQKILCVKNMITNF